MGRTGDSLGDEFPPRSGGGGTSPRGAPCREETGWPTGKIVVVVVVVVVGPWRSTTTANTSTWLAFCQVSFF